MRTVILTLLLVGATLAPSVVQAQSASEVAAARTLFEEGVAAAGEGRWADALSAFERSYEIAPRSSTLLNLAGAQAQLGRLVAASESYRRLIRDAGSAARERRLREQAQDALDAVTPRLAHLTLRVPDLREGDRVMLDDAEVARALVGVSTPVDPGTHRVIVTRGASEVGRASLNLAEGESGDLNVVLRSGDTAVVATDEDGDADDVLATTTETPAEEGGEDLTLPIVLGVVGALVVGGVVAAVVATQVPTSPSYYTGTLGDGQIRF